ncbi:hypothetical protein K439DRAFT_1642314 [Ramaria rubella]|nr:hypothetical protein K439DRAFT_1642314 [Ramaria rubella]
MCHRDARCSLRRLDRSTRDPSLYTSPDTVLEAVNDPSKEDQRRLLRQSAPLSTHYRSLRGRMSP